MYDSYVFSGWSRMSRRDLTSRVRVHFGAEYGRDRAPVVHEEEGW